MSEKEVMVMEIVRNLVEMSEENFQDCVEYAEKNDKTVRVKNLLDVLIRTAKAERKKTIQTA